MSLCPCVFTLNTGRRVKKKLTGFVISNTTLLSKFFEDHRSICYVPECICIIHSICVSQMHHVLNVNTDPRGVLHHVEEFVLRVH